MSSEIIERLPEEDFSELHSVALKSVRTFGSTYVRKVFHGRLILLKTSIERN